ncbi:MAG: PQQ-dependent sugar dehydrogenase, partial [Candidatus Kapabacteria bacterium]|nr:PQQ-dependent sugar dehydrogenase [Candidatus Kapabacteria bacterium]
MFALVLVAPLTVTGQEPGTIPWTPKDGGDLVRNTITVHPKYAALALSPTQNQVSIPRGWTASVFFAGSALDKGRFMSWGPDSVLFVANMNRGNILALPDVNRDGIADTSIVAAQGFSTGHDVRFWRDTMFVSQESGVVKLWRTDPTKYVYDQRQIIIDKASQVNQIGGNHRTRTLVIDTIRMKLYVSVGSRGNADRESNRALIEEYEMDGSGRRVFTQGTRNAVGMTLHPRTGKLWANNNGSDNQGNNVPPEWVDIVRDGGFYGYPFAYHFRRWYSFAGDYSDLLPITQADTSMLQKMTAPAALVDAHCAPMALVFTENNARAEHQYGAFMAMRGSWNRNPPSGAKIVFLAFDNDQDTIANSVRDFCT